MKTVIYCNYLYHNGINKLNREYIKLISRFARVVYLCETCEEFEYPNIECRSSKAFKELKGFRNILFGSIRQAQLIKKITKEIGAETIFVGAYENKLFGIVYHLFKPCSNIILLENNNIDHLANAKDMIIYKTYKNKVKHIAMSDFVSDRMVKSYGVRRDLVHVVYHPIYDAPVNKENPAKSEKYDAVGLSGSNDETIVSAIVMFEERTSYLKNASFRVYLKSKEIVFDDGFLFVSPEYLSSSSYESLLSNASVVLLPFRTDYLYRISGNMIESLSYDKPVLASTFLYAKVLQQKYSSVVAVCNDSEEMIMKACKYKNNITSAKEKEEFASFKAEHSQDNITIQLRKVILD